MSQRLWMGYAAFGALFVLAAWNKWSVALRMRRWLESFFDPTYLGTGFTLLAIALALWTLT